MKKWFLLLIMTIVVTSIVFAATVKVAVLPLKRLDSPSKYIQKFLTIRDLEHTFNTDDKYELIDLKETAEVFKDMNIIDLDEMEKEDMAEIGKELKADVVILGVISAISDQKFSIQFRYYSMRTDDIKSQRVDVVKDKKKRWKVLQDEFLVSVTNFFNDEINKMITLAIQDYHAENYRPAEQVLNTVLSYAPDNKEAYKYLGFIAYKQNNYDKAISDLNKAIPDSMTVKNIDILQGLSDVYRATKNNEMLIKTLMMMAELKKDPSIWLNIANLYAGEKQYIKAREALLTAIDLDPEYLEAQYRIAFLLLDMAEYNEAIPYLKKASEDNPDSDLISRRLAFAYQKAGRISEAIAEYENRIKASPLTSLNYLNLAGLYRIAASEAADSSNQALVNVYNNKALETLSKLKEIDEENPLVYLRLADVYLATNKLNDAEANADLAMDKDDTLYQPYIILATINQRKGSDQYSNFIDLEKRAAKAYGNTATQLGKQRDAARKLANTLYKKADEQLRDAKARTTEADVIADVDSKLASLAPLITQTGEAY